MSSETSKYLKFGSAVAVIVVSLIFLAYTGVQESKSYYVTIKELRGMGDSAYTKHLRVAGNVQPGSIKRSGTSVNFVLIENDQLLPVAYTGTERRLTPSKTNPRLWPKARLDAMACSMPSSCRPSARQSMRHSSRVRKPLRLACRTEQFRVTRPTV